MITREEVMNLFIEACPSFKENWEAYISSEEDRNSSTVLYSDLTCFANYLVCQKDNEMMIETKIVFDIIEQILQQGDTFVKEAITVGLLEDIQNILISQSMGLNVFNMYMHKETKKSWRDLTDFWKS